MKRTIKKCLAIIISAIMIMHSLTFLTFAEEVADLENNTADAELYVELNSCETTEDIEKLLIRYSESGTFEFGTDYIYLEDMAPVYEGMLAKKDYASDTDVQDMYNTLVTANKKSYITQGYGFGVNNSNATFTGDTAGGFASDSAVKSDGTFYKLVSGGEATLEFSDDAAGSIVQLEFDTMLYWLDGDSATRVTPYTIWVLNGTKWPQKLCAINRAGQFMSQNDQWPLQGMDASLKNKWIHMSFVLDTNENAKRLTGSYTGDGTTRQIPWAWIDSDGNVNDINGAYIYDAAVLPSNTTKTNGTLHGSGGKTSVMGLKFSPNSDAALNYIDNLSVKVYKPLYQAVNACETEAQIEEVINTYSSLGVIVTGDTASANIQEVYSALLAHADFTSSEEVQSYFSSLVNIKEKIVLSDYVSTSTWAYRSIPLLVDNPGGVTLTADSKIIFAGYLNGELSMINTTTATAKHYVRGETIVPEIDSDVFLKSVFNKCDKIKIFVWSDTEQSLSPLTSAIHFK